MKKTLFLYCLSLLFGCASPTLNSSKQNLMFVHGSHFTGESWKKVRAILDRNYATIAPTRRGRKLNDAALFYCEQIKSSAAIVAHSYGGAVANQMSRYCLEKMKMIIYVAAVSPHNQEGSFDLLSLSDQTHYSQIVNFSPQSVVPIEKDKFLRAMSLAPDIDPDEVVVVTEPVELGNEKLVIEPEGLAGIQKAYIFTENDKIIEMNSQRRYATRDRISSVHKIEAGHLPMLTHPGLLAKAIEEALRLAK